MKYTALILLILGILFGCTAEKKLVSNNSQNLSKQDLKRTAQALFIDGSIAETKGLINEAITRYTEAYAIDPQPGISYTLAKNYVRINKLSSALTFAKLAVLGDHRNIDYLLMLGSIYDASHFDDSSEVVYRAVLALDTTNVTAYYSLAQLSEAKRPSEALALYRKVIDIVGPELTVLIKIADINERQGNIEATISTVEELLQLNPSELNLQKVLIDAYIKTKNFDKALSLLDQALVSFPDDLNLVEFKGIALVQKGNMTDALTEYMKLVNNKSIPFENKIRVGLSFLASAEKDTSNLVLAKKIFEQINKDSTDWQVKAYLGEIAIRQHEDSTAIKYFEQAVKIAEWNSDVWTRLGGLLFDSRNYKDAIRFMDEAVQKFPNDFAINLIYGLSLSQNNDHEKAREILQRALNVNPRDVTALGALGYTLNQLKKDDEALTVLNKALQYDPNNLQVLSVTALIHETNKNYAVSDSLYMTALKVDSTNILILNNLAYSWADRGINLEEALKMAQQAIEKEPANSSYLDTIGWIYYKLGDYKKAKEKIEAALKLEKENATLIDHLGDVLFKLGEKKKALSNWKKAFEIDNTKTEIKIKIDKGEL